MLPAPPSPYFYDTTATRIDLGHLLLTVDALLHPRADTPYSDFPVPAIDPASWVADLGIGAVWLSRTAFLTPPASFRGCPMARPTSMTTRYYVDSDRPGLYRRPTASTDTAAYHRS